MEKKQVFFTLGAFLVKHEFVEGEELYAFWFDKNGRNLGMPPMKLIGPQAAIDYCLDMSGNKQIYEIRITERTHDETLAQMIEGKIVWPEAWKGFTS